jgi:predicted acetyltransferase
MDVTLVRAARTQRDVLARLLELNAYEFSRIDGRPIGEDGWYGYEFLDLYWSAEGRTPYLIRVDGELAGFTLVRASDGARSVAEFLVLPRFRRGGVGTFAARQLFAQDPGPWVVDQVPGNASATAFWRRAIPVPFDEETDPTGQVTQRFTI